MAAETPGCTVTAPATVSGDVPEDYDVADPPVLITEAFEWDSLPNDGTATIVDLGDATGFQSIVLALKFPFLHFVIQDNNAALAIARKNWSALPSKSVRPRATFKEVAFGDDQPNQTAPAVFLLHYTIDDLSNGAISKGLISLRKAAEQDKTNLLVLFNRPTSPPTSITQTAMPSVIGMTPSSETLFPTAEKSMTCGVKYAISSVALIEIASAAGWEPVPVEVGPGAGYLRFLAG